MDAIEEETVPMEETVEIEEEETPLIDVPQTGDPMGILAILSTLSLSGVVLLNKKRR